ncbi:MAG TPA: CBS domain-containing protein [Burkholderiales bacterium]|nr:CBS domain-containing protein [Betaproteobacteria bacterium]HQR52006.1 CBS domain-containing protein [Burkholderiales bacterium]
MLREYIPLHATAVQRDVTYHEPSQDVPARVTLDSHALDCMTDLRQVTAVTGRVDETIDAANDHMKQCGVRLLLVIDEARRVKGVISAADIVGERPMQVVQSRGVRRSDVLVRDVMTPQEELHVLHMEDVRLAKVGHIVATLKAAGRQHAVVVDLDQHGHQKVRGIFSASQIARQLGVVIQTTEVARTFAEVEAMLARGK